MYIIYIYMYVYIYMVPVYMFTIIPVRSQLGRYHLPNMHIYIYVYV